VKAGLKYLETKSFEQSDFHIARNISCLIKLSWTEDELRSRAEKMTKIIKEACGVLSN
jgi:8-amino-3,8-dideoxy-alpha-D-manno-octulosonate transaminase